MVARCVSPAEVPGSIPGPGPMPTWAHVFIFYVFLEAMTGSGISAIVTEFSSLFTALYGVITGILVPTGGQTPVSVVAWFGLLIGPLGGAMAMLRRLATSGAKK